MSDQNKFINTYIDTAINLNHEQMNSIIQLKTQLKLSSDTLAEKNIEIEKLNEKIQTLELNQSQSTIDEKEYNRALTNAKSWENDYNKMSAEIQGLKNKVSHMDTLLKQVSDMKKTISDKDSEIERLRAEINDLNTKVVNKKKPSTKKEINKKEETVLLNLLIDDDKNDNKDDF